MSHCLLNLGNFNDTLKLWNPKVEGEVISARESGDSSDNLATFAPSGSFTATTDNSIYLPMLGLGSITLRKVDPKKNPLTINGPEGGTTALEFSQDGTLLVAGGQAGHIKVWSMPDRKEILSVKRHLSSVAAIAISPNNLLVASTGGSKEIVVWNSTNGEPQFSFKSQGSVTGLCFSPDGKTLLTHGATLALWDVSQRKLIWEWSHVELSLPWGKPRFTIDGNFCVSAVREFSNDSYVVFVQRIEQPEPIVAFRGHNAKEDLSGTLAKGTKSLAMAISPDGTRVVSVVKNEVVLWELQSGREIMRLPVSQQLYADHQEEELQGILAIGWSADGRFIRAQLANGAIIEWDGPVRRS